MGISWWWRKTRSHQTVLWSSRCSGDGEEVTVKRLYREGAKVRLRPENGEHQEILVPAEEVRVQGRVVYVVHPPRLGPYGDGS